MKIEERIASQKTKRIMYRRKFVMSIKVQKILRFIPIVGIVTMFCWIGCCFKRSMRMWDFLKVLFKMFAVLLVLTVMRLLSMQLFTNPTVQTIILLVTLYLYFFGMAWLAVDAQEKMMKEDEK